MTARYLIGDVHARLAELPDDSVDLVLSSPPFLALRSYLPEDHPDKASEIGSEPTPGAFIDTMLDVVEALDRVLAPHGSLVFELGDTYSGSGGAGGDYGTGGLRDGQAKFNGSALADRLQQGKGWPLDKSLCMVPQSFAWALAYGRNPFTGRETPRWRVRNVVAWCRPNPPVGALGDKFRPATSYLTVACKSRDRYFDLDAVREAFTGHGFTEGSERRSPDEDATGRNWSQGLGTRSNTHTGAPPLDYWVIPTEPYAGSHYATFPRQLVVRPVKAMSPERVCTVCGQPSRRIVGEAEYESLRGATSHAMTDGKRRAEGVKQFTAPDGGNGSGWARRTSTLGWSDCGHNAYRRGVVLDPFAGSGTTLAVAVGHGRDAIGIDLDSRNAELAVERVGPLFLTVEVQPAIEDVATDLV